MDYTLHLGDCLDIMATIPDASVDAVIADPPYGTTACKWDSVIPFEPMWEQLKRIVKQRAAIVLFGSQPFTSALVMSNPDWFRVSWVWAKPMGTNYLNANRDPMKAHEDIVVFSDGYCTYNPQKTKGVPYASTRGSVGDFVRDKSVGGYRTVSNGDRYPLTVQNFNQVFRPVHPTQKPVALLEYLVRTYTNEGDTVLDFTMGSGTTGVACMNTGRKFVGIELDAGYFKIAEKRIEEATWQPALLREAAD